MSELLKWEKSSRNTFIDPSMKDIPCLLIISTTCGYLCYALFWYFQTCKETTDIGALQKGADFVTAFTLGFEIEVNISYITLLTIFMYIASRLLLSQCISRCLPATRSNTHHAEHKTQKAPLNGLPTRMHSQLNLSWYHSKIVFWWRQIIS